MEVRVNDRVRRVHIHQIKRLKQNTENLNYETEHADFWWIIENENKHNPTYQRYQSQVRRSSRTRRPPRHFDCEGY